MLNAIETLPESDHPLARGNFYGVGYTKAAPRDRTTLSGIIAEIFPSASGEALIKSLQTKSDVEIRHIYEVIATIFRNSTALDQVISAGSFRSFDCQDFVPLSHPDRTEADFKQLVMPELGRSRLLAARQAYALCKAWAVTPDPTSDGQVLNSSIPTLVLQGRYDVQTNTMVGQQAMAGLSHGMYLEFPKSGHGVLVFSQCAKDVGAAFVNNPTQLPNADCRAELKPKFVLPPASK